MNWLDKYQDGGTLTSKQLELKKEVARNNKKYESKAKWDEHFNEERKKEDAKKWVQNSMQEAYKSPLMSPGYFTPEGMAIGALQGAAKVGPDLYEGNYGEAAMDATMMLPFAPKGIKAATPLVKKVGRLGKDIGELMVSDIKDTAKLVNQLGQVSTKPGVVLGNTTNMENPLKVFNTIEEGSNTIQNSLSNRINLLKTDEGRKRLVQQEYDYLKKLGFNEQGIQRQAEINADNRISELQHTQVFGNVNANTIEGVDKNLLSKNIMSQEPNTAQLRYNLINNGIPGNNAHYSQTSEIPFDDKFIEKSLIDAAQLESESGKIGDATNAIYLGKHPYVGGYEAPGDIALGLGYPKAKTIVDHEIQHALQRSRTLNIDDELKALIRKEPENLSEDEKGDLSYFLYGSKGKESSAFLAEARTSMKEAGLIKHEYENISPELVEKSMKYFKKNPQKILTKQPGYIPYNELSSTRIFDIHTPTEYNFKLLSDSFNKLPAVIPGAIGVGAASLQLEQKKNGGVIKDDRGQWDHPGEITEIGSPHITMEGVHEPLIGISDTGHTQYMEPGKDYKFRGKKVIEFPLDKLNSFQDGGSLPVPERDLQKELQASLLQIKKTSSEKIPMQQLNRLDSNNIPKLPIKITDSRKIRATSQQPIRPTVDSVAGTYDLNPLNRLLTAAKKRGLTREQALDLATIGFQETGWGKTDQNIGHVLMKKGDKAISGNPYDGMIDVYQEKMKIADRLKIKDPLQRLQIYNGTGTVTPKTEANYHGFEMQNIYGVPIPKEGINMKKNPLYGKQIVDLRDNVLLKNQEFVNYFSKLYDNPLVEEQQQPKLATPDFGQMFKTPQFPKPEIYTNEQVETPELKNGGWLSKYE